MKPSNQPELSSWKEIAAYLNVSVRTAQMWERERSLPVRRLPGARSQVRASASELDAWQRPAAAPPVSSPVRRRFTALIAAALLVIAAAIFLFRPGPVAAWRIEDHKLIVTDARSRELWRKEFPTLADAHYQSDPALVWVGELDGRQTVLFLERDGRPGPNALIAYNRDGSERWRFTAGRPLKTAAASITAAFHAEHFLVAPLGRQGKMRIAVNGTHDTDFPCEVALLNPDGNVLREYWHAGHLQHFLAADLNHQGWNSLVAAGINNATKSATIVVLDPDRFQGAGQEENPAYQISGFPPPVETARVLFPRSRMNIAIEPFVAVTGFRREGEGFRLDTQHRLNPADATVFYHLNSDLSVANVSVGSSFEKAHLALEANGTLKHPLSQEEIGELNRVTYLTPRRAAPPGASQPRDLQE